MENLSPLDQTNPFQNVSYCILYDAPGTAFYQLSVTIFFTPGYSVDPSVQPTVTQNQDPGKSTEFFADFSIINNGGQNDHAVVNFDYQFSNNPDIFTFVTVRLSDSTTKAPATTTKIHYDNATNGSVVIVERVEILEI